MVEHLCWGMEEENVVCGSGRLCGAQGSWGQREKMGN